MGSIPATCEIWVDGALFADGADGDTDSPVLLDGVTLRWGRDNRLDQPDPAQLTVDILDRGGGPDRYDAVIGLGSKITVWAAVAGTRVSPFTGRVTDVTAEWDAAAVGTRVSVAAADALSGFANRFVGAEPWPAEPWWGRAHRITGQGGADWAIIPFPPGNVTVSRLDVDRQAMAGLLADLAVTGGTIIFPAMFPDGTELLVAQNPNDRASMTVLAPGGDGLWRPTPAAGLGAYELSACDLARDPVAWSRTVVDLVTRATVRWQDQSTSPGTTERSVAMVNADDEARWGARGVSLGTLLTTAADAETLCTAVLVRNQASEAYRARGLVWDLAAVTDPAATTGLAVALLDSSVRTGTAVMLTDLPDWTPAAADTGSYVEGGTYRFGGGRWLLSLLTTSAVGAGRSITYQQTPTPTPSYQQIAPDVSYLDLYGVGAPPAAPTTAAAADPADPVPGPSGVNPYGLPYPEPTDPYAQTAAALQALAQAIDPRLVNLPIQFIPKATYPTDGNGDAVIDLSATFVSIDGAVVSDNGGGYPNLLQVVQSTGSVQNKLYIRVLTTTPPDGAVWANASGTFALTVWGTPK
jgi:hypothetical protein